MKRFTMGILTSTVVVALGATAWAANPRGTSEITVKGAKISVEYGRPSLHGQTIQQELDRLPTGQYWRLGADKSTTFTTSADLEFGGVTVPKGVYSLFARKEADKKWSLVFNKLHGQWGIKRGGLANLDPKLNVASAPLEVKTAADSAEMVTIKLAKAGADGGTLTVNWGDLELATSFTVK